MLVTDDIRKEFNELIEKAYHVSSDVGREVGEILKVGRERPLSRDESVRLLSKVVEALRQAADRLGDDKAKESLKGNTMALVRHIIDVRDKMRGSMDSAKSPSKYRDILANSYNGITAGPVQPNPWFHGKEVPMNCGYVKTTDIQLWEGNERLDIHVGQFRQKHGRAPTPDELLDIMFGKLQMPGVSKDDQFEIIGLSRSIAINGVRKPPIMDIDGTLLDGNRRVAACYYILNNDEFTTEQKRRAEYIFAWQLTRHADDDDRRRVVVSLNFEPDYKIDWPDYVKARKVYEEWQSTLALEARTPGSKRQAEMKRGLSQKYALGPDTSVVNRYLKMVDWANDFETYQISEKHSDEFEVKHKANKYFQYFDELSKGSSPGGVAHVLGQDEAFKHLAFDLLFQGKFNNWRDIRNLRHVYGNEEARALLLRAREELDQEEAQDLVEQAGNIANLKRAETRVFGANTRIEVFVKWLEELPVKAFRDDIRPENLLRLLNALKLTQRQVEHVLGKDALRS